MANRRLAVSVGNFSSVCADERQIRIDLRAARRRTDPGQAGLRQHPRHRGVMHVQLAGDGADAPLLDVVVAQDLRLELRRDGHAAAPGVAAAARLRRRRRRNPDADQRRAATIRTSGSARTRTATAGHRPAIAAAGRLLAVDRSFQRQQDHPRRRRGTLMRHVLLPGAPAARARRMVQAARGGSPGNAGRRHAAPGCRASCAQSPAQ